MSLSLKPTKTSWMLPWAAEESFPDLLRTTPFPPLNWAQWDVCQIARITSIRRITWNLENRITQTMPFHKVFWLWTVDHGERWLERKHSQQGTLKMGRRLWGLCSFGGYSGVRGGQVMGKHWCKVTQELFRLILIVAGNRSRPGEGWFLFHPLNQSLNWRTLQTKTKTVPIPHLMFASCCSEIWHPWNLALRT